MTGFLEITVRAGSPEDTIFRAHFAEAKPATLTLEGIGPVEVEVRSYVQRRATVTYRLEFRS